MTIGRGRLAGAIMLLTCAALVLIWDHYATRNELPSLAKLMTTPLSDFRAADRARAKPASPTVKLAPSPSTGGASRAAVEKFPAEVSAPPTQSRNAASERPPNKPSSATLVAATTESNAAETALRKEPEPQPVAAPAGGVGMQPGALVANGRQAPELSLPLTSADIEELVLTKRAVVLVENDDGRAVYFLDRPDGSFRSMTEISAANVSNRYVRVSDPGLVSSWQVRLGQLPSQSLKFGLRFTKKFDEDLMEKQFASLSDRGIDFDKALARGARIITYASVVNGQFAIDRVSVEELPLNSAE